MAQWREGHKETASVRQGQALREPLLVFRESDSGPWSCRAWSPRQPSEVRSGRKTHSAELCCLKVLRESVRTAGPWDLVGDNYNLAKKLKIPSHRGVASTLNRQ